MGNPNNSPSPSQYHDTSVDNLIVPNVFKLSPGSRNEDTKVINANNCECVTMGNQVDNFDDKRSGQKFQDNIALNSPLNVNNLLNSTTNPANLSIFNSPYFNKFASPTRNSGNPQHTFLPSTLRKNSNLVANTSLDIHFTPSVSRILKLEVAQNGSNNNNTSKFQNVSSFNSTPVPKHQLSKIKSNSLQTNQSTPSINTNALDQEKSLMSQSFFSNGIFFNPENSNAHNMNSSSSINNPNLDIIKTPPPPAKRHLQYASNAMSLSSASKDPEYFSFNMNSILRNTASAIPTMATSSAQKVSNGMMQPLLTIRDRKSIVVPSSSNATTPKSSIRNTNKANTGSSLYPEFFPGNESFSTEFQKYIATNGNSTITNITTNAIINNNNTSSKSTAPQDLLRITPYRPTDCSTANILGTTTIERIKREIIDQHHSVAIGDDHGGNIGEEDAGVVCGKHDSSCFDSPTRVKVGRYQHHNHISQPGVGQILGSGNNGNSNVHTLHSSQRGRQGNNSNSVHQIKQNECENGVKKLNNTIAPSSISIQSHRLNSEDLEVDIITSPSRYAGISFVERIRSYCEEQESNSGSSNGNANNSRDNINENGLVSAVDDDDIIDTDAILVESTPTKRSASFSSIGNSKIASKKISKATTKNQSSAITSNTNKKYSKNSNAASVNKSEYKKSTSSIISRKKKISSSDMKKPPVVNSTTNDDDKDTEYEDDDEDEDDEKDLNVGDSLTGTGHIIAVASNQVIMNSAYNFTDFQNLPHVHSQQPQHFISNRNSNNIDDSPLTIIPHSMNIHKPQQSQVQHTMGYSPILYSRSISGFDDHVSTTRNDGDDHTHADDPDGTLSLPSSPIRDEESTSSISNVSNSNFNVSSSAIRYSSTASSSIIEDRMVESKETFPIQSQQSHHTTNNHHNHSQFHHSNISMANATTSSNISDSFLEHHGNHSNHNSSSFLSNNTSSNSSTINIPHPAIGTFQTKTRINDNHEYSSMPVKILKSSYNNNIKPAPFFNDNIQSMNQMVHNGMSSKKKSNKRKRGSELSVIYSKYMSNPQDTMKTVASSNKRLKSKSSKKAAVRKSELINENASGLINNSANKKRAFFVAQTVDDKENTPQLQMSIMNNNKIALANVNHDNSKISPLKDIAVNVSNANGNEIVIKKGVVRAKATPHLIANNNRS